MSGLQADVHAVEEAARDLTTAVDRLCRSHPLTLDLRRLVEDAKRIRVDLDLLTTHNPALASASTGRRDPGDPGYDPREFGDGAFEDPNR